MKQVSVRFLKQGHINLNVSSNLSIEEVRQLAKEKLDSMSDQDLVMAMSDCAPSGPNPSRFDLDNFTVEAIEDSDYSLLYSSNLWEEYLNEN